VETINGYEDVPENDDKLLKKDTKNQLVSVSIEANIRHSNFTNLQVVDSLIFVEYDHMKNFKP
jgi:hypothetical protein